MLISDNLPVRQNISILTLHVYRMKMYGHCNVLQKGYFQAGADKSKLFTFDFIKARNSHYWTLGT